MQSIQVDLGSLLCSGNPRGKIAYFMQSIQVDLDSLLCSGILVYNITHKMGMDILQFLLFIRIFLV